MAQLVRCKCSCPPPKNNKFHLFTGGDVKRKSIAVFPDLSLGTEGSVISGLSSAFKVVQRMPIGQNCVSPSCLSASCGAVTSGSAIFVPKVPGSCQCPPG